MKRFESHEKIGRNDPCWCGSGKKFKKCHLHREDEDPIQPWQTDKDFRRALGHQQCLAPDPWRKNCSSQISKAHTVPRSGSLARIARDGHVYALQVRMQQLANTDGVPRPGLVGINKASTFTGFCSEHDRSIFAPLENKPFMATPEQCFLLSYRALAREIFTKQAMHSLVGPYRLMDQGMPLGSQLSVQTIASALYTGYSTSMKDLWYLKDIYDDILVTLSFDGVRAYVIELEGIPQVMCSGGFYPEQDFEGNEMQDLLDFGRVPSLLTVTSFYGGQRGMIVLSWLDRDDPACIPFVESLYRTGDDTVTDALMRLLFTHFENIHIQPQWWEELSTECQQALMARFYASVHPFTPRAEGFLTDDGLRFDPWPVVGRRCFGFEL